MSRTYLTKCHPDFHLPADVVVGENFNAQAYVERLKDSQIDAVVFFGKCHYGFSYYPTKIGTVHPKLMTDMLGEIVKACRRENVGISAYYSVFLDTAAARLHPDWVLKAETNEIEGGFNSKKFEQICVNSDYCDKLLLPQSIEIITNYDVDELFYDTMTGFTPCYCDKCKELFGKDIPLNADNPDWLEYVNWYNNQYEAFFAKVIQVLKEINPKVSVIFNWQWSARLPGNPAPNTKRLAGDLYPSGSTSSYYSHYWAGTDYPFDYMCGRFMHGLSEWSNNTPETLKYTAAATIANGGSFYLIDRQLPNGDLEERAWPLLKDVFTFVNERREFVENTRHVPETAVLQSLEHIVGGHNEYFPDLEMRKQRIVPMTSFAQIMRNRSRHYTPLNTDNLKRRMFEYKLVVLPEADFLDSAMKTLLFQYVENGGKLLIFQSGSKDIMDEDILNLAGVTFQKFSDLDYGYIHTQNGGIPDPIHIRLKFALVKPHADTKTLHHYVSPLSDGNSGEQFGHGFAPPTTPSNYAVVTSRKLGAGEIVYVSAPILTSHDAYFNPQITGLVLKLMDRLLESPMVSVKTKAQVEMVAVRKEDDLIVHLVNHSAKEVLAGYWCPILEFIPELRDIEISIEALREDYELQSFPCETQIKPTYVAKRLIFTVPSLEIMNSYRVKDYFNSSLNSF